MVTDALDCSCVFPKLLAMTYALAVRSSWLVGSVLEHMPLHQMTLEMLESNIACEVPAAASMSRAVTASAPSSSSSVHDRVELPKQDYWTESETSWVRVHVHPRTTFFYPADGLNGPDLSELHDLRHTFLVYQDGSKDSQSHNWRDAHWGKAKVRSKWTGRSVFPKATAPPSDAACMDASGAPVHPGSQGDLRVGLSGMRSQLAAAQRRDPRLSEIILYLRKEKAGSYLPEPRGASLKKVRERSYQYRLTSDNVLVARFDNDSIHEDRPVYRARYCV